MIDSLNNIILRISAILILLSSVMYIVLPSIAPWIMAISSIAFAVSTVLSPYPGESIRGKRLFHFQVFSTVLMIVSAYLMFRQRNEWSLILLCGAVFMLYAAIMIPRELEKEQEEKNMKNDVKR